MLFSLVESVHVLSLHILLILFYFLAVNDGREALSTASRAGLYFTAASALLTWRVLFI